MTDQTAIYDAIDAFQRTHRLPGLQHAQIRGLLAEHLARVLPAAPAAVPSAPANGASAPSDEDFLVAVEEALESTLLPSPGVSVLERTLDAVTGALAPLVAKVRAASTPAAPPAPADRASVLSDAERTMLNYALNQAQLRMWATGKFTDEDQAAIVSLRRMADEAQQPAVVTTVERAAARGMTDTEYRAASHRAAVEAVRAAAKGMYAEVGLRVMDALSEAQQPETVPEQVSLTRGQLAALLAHHADVLAAQWRAVAPGAGAWEVAAALSLTSHANELTDDEETPAVAELLDSILTFRDEQPADEAQQPETPCSRQCSEQHTYMGGCALKPPPMDPRRILGIDPNFARGSDEPTAVSQPGKEA